MADPTNRSKPKVYCWIILLLAACLAATGCGQAAPAAQALSSPQPSGLNGLDPGGTPVFTSSSKPAGAESSPTDPYLDADNAEVDVTYRQLTVRIPGRNLNDVSTVRFECEKNSVDLVTTSSTADLLTISARTGSMVEQVCKLAVETASGVSNEIEADLRGLFEPRFVLLSRMLWAGTQMKSSDQPMLNWDQWNYLYTNDDYTIVSAPNPKAPEEYFSLENPDLRFTAVLPVEDWWDCVDYGVCSKASSYYR